MCFALTVFYTMAYTEMCAAHSAVRLKHSSIAFSYPLIHFLKISTISCVIVESWAFIGENGPNEASLFAILCKRYTTMQFYLQDALISMSNHFPASSPSIY